MKPKLKKYRVTYTVYNNKETEVNVKIFEARDAECLNRQLLDRGVFFAKEIEEIN